LTADLSDHHPVRETTGGGCAVCGAPRDPAGGALCGDCRSARREPELDTAAELGWRVGGGLRLLVGRAHAVRLDGSGGRVVTVPDAHVLDPARRRARALATRLGLPAGAALTLAGEPVATEDLTAGAVWSSVTRDAWWRAGEAAPGAGAISAEALALAPDLTELPELPGEQPVRGEGELGLTQLLARLRDEEPPPPGPAVTGVPFAVVRRADLREPGLVLRETWCTSGEEPAAAAVTTAAFGRGDGDEAVATVGPVTVSVTRLHRSYLVRCADDEAITPSFVPGVEGATAAGEAKLARVLASAGPRAAGRVLVRHPWEPPGTEDLQFSKAAEGTEVDRWFEEVPALVDAPDGEPVVEPPSWLDRGTTDPATDPDGDPDGGTGDGAAGTAAADDPDATIARDAAAATELRDGETLAFLRTLHEPVAPLAVARCLRVDEWWASPDGTAERRHLVAPGAPLDATLAGRALHAPGAPVLAALDDGAEGDVAVAVDSRGHLHAAEHRTRCPVCERASCPACGPDGALADCGSCGHPACGACRSAAHPGVVVATCENCGAAGCPGCGRDPGIAGCAACDRPMCRDCRPDGSLCATCLDPQRDANLDTSWERAWRLGGDVLLLVGAAHAVLVTWDRRREVVPDDRAGERHDRLRSVAAGLGLPPGSTLVLGAPLTDAAPLRAGALWSDVRHDVAHAPGDASLAAPDGAALDLLPARRGAADAPPAATGETVAGLAGLLARLRGEDPPPVPPAVVATPVTVVRRLDVGRKGETTTLTLRELRVEGDAGPREAEPVTAALTAVPGAAGQHPGGQHLGAAQIGDLLVTVVRLHRSYLLTLFDGEHRHQVFVPGAEGATVSGETALAGLAATAGPYGPPRVVVRHPVQPPPTAVLRFREPEEGTTVSRTVRRLPALVDDGLGDPMVEPPEEQTGAPALPSGLPAAAGTPDDADPVVVADFAAREAFAALHQQLTPVSLTTVLLVDERWTSPHGVARRSYLAAPAPPLDPQVSAGRSMVPVSETLLPRLDDGTAAGAVVAVDNRGHLHEASRRMRCPVCATVSCPACGPAGQVAGCVTCGRDACGVCRATPHPGVTNATCERCGDSACADCGRDLAVGGCRLCGRTVCGTSLADGVCETCRALRPATDEERNALPAILASTGLDIRVGHDPGGTVAVLLGKHRREVAVVREDAVLRWETAADDDPTVLAVRLAMAAQAGIGDVAVRVVPPLSPPEPGEHVLLDREDVGELLWDAFIGDTRVAGTDRSPGAILEEPPAAYAADVLRAVVAAMPPAGAAPVPARPEAAAVIARVGAGRTVEARVRCAVETVRHLVLVTGDGIVRRTSAGGYDTDETHPWRATGEPPDWAGDGWNPVPDVVGLAEAAPFSAVVAVAGDHVLLGVGRQDAGHAWFAASEAPQDVVRLAAGELFRGRRELLTVVRATFPRDVRGPRVDGATLVDRRCTPFLEAITRSVAGPDAPEATEQAVAEYGGPENRPALPVVGGRLPLSFATPLRAMAERQAPLRILAGLGQNVEESWRAADGSALTITYRLVPGETAGRITDVTTGQPIRDARVCRSGHVVSDVHRCPECVTDTCGACPDNARPCAVCGILLCGSCAAPDGRCGACGRLEKLGLLKRQKLRLPTGSRAWHGADVHAEVLVVAAGEDQWWVERTDASGTTRRDLPKAPFPT
jgi:hypothetical protein